MSISRKTGVGPARRFHPMPSKPWRAMALLGAALLAVPASQAATDTGATVLALDTYQGKQHAITALVHGKPHRLLFDTGEGATMISPGLAQEIGCVPWGNEVVFRMLGERFEAPRCDDVGIELSGLGLTAPNALVYDLSKLTGPDAPALDGAIGLDLFAGRTITLDYPASRVLVESPHSARTRAAAGIEVPLRLSRPANGAGLDIYLGVQTPRGLAWMTLDSANAGPTIFVSPAMAPLFGLKADTRAPQPVRLDLGHGLILQTQARVFPDMIMDGNIGMQWLKHHVVTLDLAAGRAWVAGPAP